MPAPYIMYTKYTTSHEFKWTIFSFALGDLNVTEASLIIVWWPLRGLWCSSGIPPLLCCNSKRIPSNFQSNHKNKVLAFQNELCWMRFKLRMIERFPHWAEADVRAEVSERLKAQSSALPCMPSQGGGWFVEGGGQGRECHCRVCVAAQQTDSSHFLTLTWWVGLQLFFDFLFSSWARSSTVSRSASALYKGFHTSLF